MYARPAVDAQLAVILITKPHARNVRITFGKQNRI